MNVISCANLIADDPDAHKDVGSRRHLADKSSCQNSNLYDCQSNVDHTDRRHGSGTKIPNTCQIAGSRQWPY